jgi:hypothetical protein
MGSKSSKVLNLFLPIFKSFIKIYFYQIILHALSTNFQLQFACHCFQFNIKSVKLFLRLFAVRNKVSRYDGEIRTHEVRE